MKIKLEEIRQLQIDDIKHKIEGLEKELYNLKQQSQTARLDKPHRIKDLRKKIAQYRTIIREKEINNAGKQPK
ncbi:MAG: 50S ribosomal protein L29 [Candidatus Omnitrophica bacterium]|nr:50S ribosomal protein L29 [Candidatus Omnitrophota bacterium]